MGSASGIRIADYGPVGLVDVTRAPGYVPVLGGPDERPGDYLVADWAGPAYTNPPAANDRYPAPTKAELVTVWQRQGGSVMSVTADGKTTDFAIPPHLLGSLARAFIGALEERAA
jgi:hypothetical protein